MVGNAHPTQAKKDSIAKRKPMKSSYDHDFYNWAMYNAQLLKEGKLAQADIEQIAIELESMGRSEYNALVSRLGILLAHLLKWHYQPEHRSWSWECTIREQRVQITRLLRQNPSLKAKLETIMADAYEDAVLIAERETHIHRHNFPAICQWAFEQIMTTTYSLKEL